MASVLAFLTANATVIIAVVYALLNLFVALFKANTKVTGFLGVLRSLVERISVLVPQNAEGTVKLPGVAASPRVTPIMESK